MVTSFEKEYVFLYTAYIILGFVFMVFIKAVFLEVIYSRKNKDKVLKLKPLRALARAVQKGDTQKIKSLLKEGIDPNTEVSLLEFPEDGEPMTALARAVANDQKEIVKLLLSEGASFLKRSGVKSPLSPAIYQKNLEMIDLFLANGLVLNSYDFPLDEVVKTGDAVFLKGLMKRGLHVKKGTNTALMLAEKDYWGHPDEGKGDREEVIQILKKAMVRL